MVVLIIGGAGFIGCNVAEFHANRGDKIVIFDNLSRRGSSLNLSYLLEKYRNIEFVYGDIRNPYDLMPVFQKKHFYCVYHEAAQVAVTTSVRNPREDFEINALGTFNILEAMRTVKSDAILLYASTNKVYGNMEDVEIEERDGRYRYKEIQDGISESRLLDFHSPYGCSKGAAEQYVRDYSRIYNLKTIIFRQSCIYGYRQFGIEDQGWVAWFTIAAAFDNEITIYGDGKQVRDVLFIDDLIKAYSMAIENVGVTNGQIYNIGGGHFQMSLLKLLNCLEKYIGRKIDVSYSDWRAGDQLIYVSNNAKAKKDFGWEPVVSAKDGVKKLYMWVTENKKLFRSVGIIN